MYVDVRYIKPDSEILNNLKKATSFMQYEEKKNPTTQKKINKLYDILDKILELRKLL